MSETFIIAEAGVNHNGDVKIARKMVDAAKQAGADAVKFQTFKAENVASKYAAKADYQKKTTSKRESQFDMLKRLELDSKAYSELNDYCKKKNIVFLSSPFDLDSIDLLKNLGLKIFKIPSGEIINLPYLRKIGRLRKRIILSTGMAKLNEIKNAVGILTTEGTLKKNITVLHCNTEYPTPYEDVNLRAMVTIKQSLNISVGYSDHSFGIEAAIAATALGATVIEKHFTLDKHMKGPDHSSSLEPDELKLMVKSIRNVTKAMGSCVKTPTPSELKNKNIVRKSIVAARDIYKGEFFTEDNITTKRPGTGISPMRWDFVIGQRAKRNFREDEFIEI